MQPGRAVLRFLERSIRIVDVLRWLKDRRNAAVLVVGAASLRGFQLKKFFASCCAACGSYSRAADMSASPMHVNWSLWKLYT